jgi:hypothetical protein
VAVGQWKDNQATAAEGWLKSHEKRKQSHSLGFVGKDPEVKYTASGIPVCRQKRD